MHERGKEGGVPECVRAREPACGRWAGAFRCRCVFAAVCCCEVAAAAGCCCGMLLLRAAAAAACCCCCAPNGGRARGAQQQALPPLHHHAGGATVSNLGSPVLSGSGTKPSTTSTVEQPAYSVRAPAPAVAAAIVGAELRLRGPRT